MSEYPTIPLPRLQRVSAIEEMRQRLSDFYAEMNSRRTVRDFFGPTGAEGHYRDRFKSS